MTACTYITGSICLTANHIFAPLHGNKEGDLELTEHAFIFLEDMIQRTSSKPLQHTRDSWNELLQSARAASSQFALPDAS
jgi:hypothetical protein